MITRPNGLAQREASRASKFVQQKDLYDSFQPLLALIEQKQREATRAHSHAKISTILERLRKTSQSTTRTRSDRPSMHAGRQAGAN